MYFHTNLKEMKNETKRKNAATVGALFLIAMVASLVGGGMVESVISVPETFAAVSENETLLVTGVLLNW